MTEPEPVAETVTDDYWDALIGDLHQLADEIRSTQLPSQPHDVDVAGRTRHAIRKLTDWVRSLEAEIEPGTEGDEYKVVERRTAKRSFHTARLLDEFGNRGASFMDLIRADAIRIQWQWSNTRKAAATYGATLNITQNELDDDGELGDGLPMIGEVWQHKHVIEGKQ